MTQFLEFLPIVFFFVVYQMDGTTIEFLGFSHELDGIFSATLALMAATVLQVVLTRLITGHVEKRLWWLLAIVVVMGSLTVGLRNAEFLYWKPTVFNWALALAFLGFGIFSDKNLLERAMGSQLQAPKKVWSRLNITYAAYFAVVGTANIYVAYNYSEQTWVDYKLWSMFVFTGFILVVTMVLLFPHLKDQASTEEGS